MNPYWGWPDAIKDTSPLVEVCYLCVYLFFNIMILIWFQGENIGHVHLSYQSE